MFNSLKKKKVRISVAFMSAKDMQDQMVKYFEGVLIRQAPIGGQFFLILDNGMMINVKYIQTIEIIG